MSTWSIHQCLRASFRRCAFHTPLLEKAISWCSVGKQLPVPLYYPCLLLSVMTTVRFGKTVVIQVPPAPTLLSSARIPTTVVHSVVVPCSHGAHCGGRTCHPDCCGTFTMPAPAPAPVRAPTNIAVTLKAARAKKCCCKRKKKVVKKATTVYMVKTRAPPPPPPPPPVTLLIPAPPPPPPAVTIVIPPAPKHRKKKKCVKAVKVVKQVKEQSVKISVKH